ncbi:unnamed protein product [Camellia sinensis]
MSEATSAAGAPSANVFRPPTAMIPGATPSSASNVSQAFQFSSGNPRIEETRGFMHLYRNDFASSSPELPMNDGVEDRYSVLIRFDDQSSTDAFYKHFNGRRYSSLEVEACRVLFTIDVQYTGLIEHAQTSPASSTEQPTCPVCLVLRGNGVYWFALCFMRLEQDMSGILTTICNHSFHCSCISKWADSSCPVCRYCQQQPEKSICFVCQTSENLWICVICGFVGCGRYKEGHSIRHWKETQHCYSLELDTQRVWDYAGDNYVHRLIQSKTDRKLVELNHYCAHADDGCGSCNCSIDTGFSETLLNSKVENIVNEYSELLTTQLENQKIGQIYFESLLQEVEEEPEREISEAIEKAATGNQKLQKMQAKLDKCDQEKSFFDEINKSLLKNQDILKASIVEIEEREKKTLKLKDDKIRELEEQLGNLMVCLEAGSTVEQLS